MAVRSKSGTKYIAVTLMVWADDDGKHIHLTSNDTVLHTTVNDEDGSIRQHSNLYRHLKKMLVAAGKWPE
jgi:hypothetical protein